MYASTGFYYDNYIAFDMGSIPIAQFAYWEQQAASWLNKLTQNRIEEADEAVSRAVCEIAEILYKEEQSGGIASENNDGYSVTYDKTRSLSEKISDIAERYLGDTGFLYRGF